LAEGARGSVEALSLDSSVPGAHRLIATVKHIYEWDTAGAEQEFQAAFKTARNDAETQMTYGLFLAQIGRVEEGLAAAQLAELDPLSSRISGTKEKMFMIARRYDEVFKQAQRTSEAQSKQYGHDSSCARDVPNSGALRRGD
jgi:Tfp pilus assembly protein PilF